MVQSAEEKFRLTMMSQLQVATNSAKQQAHLQYRLIGKLIMMGNTL